MDRLEAEVDQTSRMANVTCHQCLIRLYQTTNKKGIVGLAVMGEQTDSQSINIIRHSMLNNIIHMIGLGR
jgi:hypothetical protein